MRPGAWLVNIARGALLDADAAIAHLNTGHLAGLGLDVFPTEPYPADGPLLAHPRIVATAHTAALTSDYFAAASGDSATPSPATSIISHRPDSSDERGTNLRWTAEATLTRNGSRGSAAHHRESLRHSRRPGRPRTSMANSCRFPNERSGS